MNIFVLANNPRDAAVAHCDKHVVKMITETAQLLSTAHAVLDQTTDPDFYKPTHVNHPCNKWVRETSENYVWARSLLGELLHEYDRRFGKRDKFERARKMTMKGIPKSIRIAERTPFALAMPDECKVSDDPVECYRNYYLTHKAEFAKWRLREPVWWRK